MMGLMILGALAVYLLVSIFVTKKVAGWAKANNKKAWVWGGLAALVMYNLVFWDLIPTLVMHKYYCDTQAGFWVYKTPEQWKAENPDVETLDDQIYLKNSIHTGEKGNSSLTYQLNSGLNRKSTEFSISSWLPIYKQEETITETGSNKALMHYVDFWAGYFDEKSISNLKWDIGSCKSMHVNINTLEQTSQKFVQIGKEISK